MERLIAEIAESNRVGLFRRFEIMRHWLSDSAGGRPPRRSRPDGLHMTDRSYACLASGLADAIAQNWRQYQADRLARTARLATGARQLPIRAAATEPSSPARPLAVRQPIGLMPGFAAARRVHAGSAAHSGASMRRARQQLIRALTKKIEIGNCASLI